MSAVVLIFTSVLLLLISKGIAQDDEGPYKGKHIGKLNSYHHQVSGDVYAVDDYTLLLKAFSYDGNGADTFFWAGASNRPGPQGFIVPDEYGKTNVLPRYLNKDFTLTLPDNKKITDIKWFAIYDLWNQNTFGDIYIQEEFEPPTVQKIPQLSGKSHKVSSAAIEILDAKKIRLNEFTYDGKALKAHFWVGVGAQPVSKGFKVPDEYGYLDPLRAYKRETIILELPGELTIFNIDWFSIFDLDTKENLGSIVIPDGLNVPPSLIKVFPHKDHLPNCLQLHKDFQVSWEIFGPAITIQLAGQVEENEYMAFGISGSPEQSQMLGSDVTVAYVDGYRGFATDYNITALTPCVKVLGQYKGVCKDDLVGGQESNQMHTSTRDNGINVITYRRSLISPDSGDKEYPTEGSIYVIWAIGRLDENKEPTFHDLYPKSNMSIELHPNESSSNCFAFTRSEVQPIEVWTKGQIYDKTIRAFKAYLGPSGGKKGYQGATGQTSTTLAWYINGYLAPELWLRRGLTYAFKVYGGNNPHSAEFYHPLIITDERHGGFDKLSDEAQSKIRVLTGVEYSRRGRPRPTAAGPLCLSRHKPGIDRRLDDDFATFKKFNRSLEYACEEGEAGVLEFTPNSSWPDIVYYNSFTQANMGWKIHIIDSFSARSCASALIHGGGTNVLPRYLNKDFTLTLPDNKKITDIKWFAIYDLWNQNTFGDIYIQEEFEPPTVQKIPQLSGKSHKVSSAAIEILDAKKIRLNEFTYDGKALKAHFWVGVGAQPVSKGFKVPDEYGYLDPLRAYKRETIILELPGELTIFNIDWFSIFDLDTKENLGSIVIPDGLNVPPSLIKVFPHKDHLPNCLQLHKDFQVSWEIFGPAITIQLAGQVEENEYMAFGISGSPEQSQMLGSDVTVAYVDGYRGFATDYNITALTPCVKVLGQYKGVCKDDLVGGQESNQMHTSTRDNGINVITYRRSLISPDSGDKEYPTEGSIYVIWAIGRLDENKEPTFHDLYPKSNMSIELHPNESSSNCFAFTRSEVQPIEVWTKGQIYDKTIRAFKAYLGPSGGKKGYQGATGQTSTTLAWYINGYLAPELWLRRGLTYAFKVYGGNNPHSAEFYHPLIITDERHGGFDKLSDEAQSKIRVLTGVEYSRRGRPRPTAAGPLCLSRHKPGIDRRLDDDFATFKKFNRSLEYACEEGEAGVLEFTPNSSWPDIVYYNSFTQANMGWKIHIIDSFSARSCARALIHGGGLVVMVLFAKQFL